MQTLRATSCIQTEDASSCTKVWVCKLISFYGVFICKVVQGRVWESASRAECANSDNVLSIIDREMAILAL